MRRGQMPTYARLTISSLDVGIDPVFSYFFRIDTAIIREFAISLCAHTMLLQAHVKYRKKYWADNELTTFEIMAWMLRPVKTTAFY